MQRPHILFVFSDQQHWQAAGFADDTFATPALDRLAGESANFSQAFCTTPQCSPSRSSLLTGLYPSRTGVWGNVGAAGGAPLIHRSIGALLQATGYRTAYFGKWHLGKDPVGTSGWDEDFGVTGPETTDDAEVTRRALDFLDRHADSDRPFALFLSYNNPHDIYRWQHDNPPATDAAPHPTTWRSEPYPDRPGIQWQFMTEDQGTCIHGRDADAWQRYRDCYRAKTALYDEDLGRVLDRLHQHNLWDRTATVVTSDHGDMDGQHGLVYKGPFLYEHMMRVPLLIRLPEAYGGRPAQRFDNVLTVNVDLVPTLLDIARAPAVPCDGRSLLPLLTGKGSWTRREAVLGEYYSKQHWVNPIRMVRTRDWKYNRYAVWGEELYDLRSDPDETVNRVDDPACAETLAALRTRLEIWMQERDDPFRRQAPTTRDGAPLDPGEPPRQTKESS